MMNGIIFAFRFLFRNKWKIILTVWFALFFFFILFPVNDLNDLITTQISKLTQKTLFIQFDTLSLNPFGPKITLEKVFVESGSIPTITVNELSVLPSLSALISRQPEGVVVAQGFLKGDIQIQIKAAPKSDGGLPRSKLEVQVKNINLKDLRELASLPVVIQGKLNLTSTALADLTLTEQPELELNLTISKFEMPNSSLVLSDLGRVSLPEVKLGQIELKGKLAGGKFVIESGKFGQSSDDLHGDIKGDLGITFANRSGQIIPVMGAYNIDLNLSATYAFKERAKFFLNFLDGYKTDSPTGANYKFKIRATAAGMPPQFTRLQ